MKIDVNAKGSLFMIELAEPPRAGASTMSRSPLLARARHATGRRQTGRPDQHDGSRRPDRVSAAGRHLIGRYAKRGAPRRPAVHHQPSQRPGCGRSAAGTVLRRRCAPPPGGWPVARGVRRCRCRHAEGAAVGGLLPRDRRRKPCLPNGLWHARPQPQAGLVSRAHRGRLRLT